MAIQSFGNTLTEKIFRGIQDREVLKFPPNLLTIAQRKLDMLDAASEIRDLASPPGNKLEKKKGKLRQYWSIRINDQWRVIFKWQDAGLHDVTITDYH